MPVALLEDLQEGGLSIYVEKPGFSYGHDALLLSRFARIKPGDKLLDLCCGCGILAILLQGRHGADTAALDIREEALALLARSARHNGQPIRCIGADVRTFRLGPQERPYDAIVCNPPYHRGGTPSPDGQRRLCTSQGADGGAAIEDIALCAGRLLKNGGRFFLCYPAAGLAALCAALVNAGLSPKRMAPVAAGQKPPYLVLLEARKGGGEGLVWEDTLRI